MASEWDREELRLKTLEEHCDPGTIGLLMTLGVQPGSRCLEVGAGAGSIARWLSTAVGPTRTADHPHRGGGHIDPRAGPRQPNAEHAARLAVGDSPLGWRRDPDDLVRGEPVPGRSSSGRRRSRGLRSRRRRERNLRRLSAACEPGSEPDADSISDSAWRVASGCSMRRTWPGVARSVPGRLTEAEDGV